MKLSERLRCFEKLAILLQSTNSIVEKRMILKQVPNEMDDDIQYIFEILAGQHKFGFTYVDFGETYDCDMPPEFETKTIKEYLAPLNNCNLTQDWSAGQVIACCQACRWFAHIVEPIVNRTLKLGIGRSVLPKDGLSAMLGKAYEGQPIVGNKYYITEKLDGNRCIARFDGLKWNFTSRNGKPMKVNFDMTGLPTEYIYDGEVMSREQTQASIELQQYIRNGVSADSGVQGSFNNTSGLINSKYGDKSNLVYNIFDIMADDVPYHERRDVLNIIHSDQLNRVHSDWRIVPILSYYSSYDLFNNDIHGLLDTVTAKGAEGLMINLGDGKYEHKRTNQLLKYKKVQTMDLTVVDVKYGTGKYEGMIGALECAGDFGDKFVSVQVGSGLSDEQRELWAINPSAIIGKIVEIAYFSESQNKSTNGSTYYSLRFPRLKQIRNDKTEASKY